MFLISKDQFASRRKENQCCCSFLQTIACLSLFPGLFLIIIFFSAEKSICFFFSAKIPRYLSTHTQKKMCPPQQNNLFSVRIPICVYFLWQHTHTHSNCVFLFFFLFFFLFGILSLSLIMICVIIVSIRTVPTQNNPRLVLFLFFYILSLSK